MNEYKNFFRSTKIRHLILSALRFIPDEQMIKLQYRIKMGRKLDLNNPKTYTEKLQWYKLYYRNPLLTQCADKHAVRDYLKSIGYEDLACREYGVYDRAEDIPFDSLPEKFVIKTTNGSGTNILCKNKSELHKEDVISEVNSWLKRDCFGLGREWAYKDIKPRVIVEEYLEDNTNEFEGINDYKFICFDGKVHYVVFDVDRYTDHKRSIYDADWNYLDIATDCKKLDNTIPRPDGFEEMKKVAEALSAEFPEVRVDLYWLNNRVYFGELTFYPWAGYVVFEPEQFDFELGEKFNLSEKQET